MCIRDRLPVISYLCSQNGSKSCWMKCLNQVLQEKGNIVKKNILIQTKLLVCSIIVVGFLLTTILSYRAKMCIRDRAYEDTDKNQTY